MDGGTAISARTARALFPIDAGTTYLNHGTVGVTPWPVLRRRAALLEEIEKHPARFMLRELMRLDASTSANVLPGTLRLRAATARVAMFLGAARYDLVFVDNATAGVNAVLRSIDLEPGSEVLVHDHAYGGVARATARIADERGWTVASRASVRWYVSRFRRRSSEVTPPMRSGCAIASSSSIGSRSPCSREKAISTCACRCRSTTMPAMSSA